MEWIITETRIGRESTTEMPPQLDPSGQGAPFRPRRTLKNDIDAQIREDLSESLRTLKVLDCRL